ncbi:MAG: MFS transporter, partial [Bacteroidetes bacterium]
AIFPAYYNQVTRLNGSNVVQFLGLNIENTALYSINMGLAFGVVALLSPLLSSISDYTGRQKAFMRLFCYLGVLGCALLFWFDSREQLPVGLIGMMIATIGYSGSIVFYNSYLPLIATEDRQDRVSAKGFSYGYIGSTILLMICLALIMNRERLGVENTTLMPRVAFLLTALWWLGFAHITFARLPARLKAEKQEGHYLLNGYRELLKIWNRLKQERQLRTFLFSFFFYIMGVQTVMFMAASFGEKEIHLKVTQLIITILVLEYVGIAGAYFFAWLSGKIGNLRGLTVAVVIWIAICIGSLYITTPLHFYIAGGFIGMVMGGIQALSRSTYSKIIPETGNNAGYFSFYDVSEKVAMMCGLLIWGYMDNLTGSMRNSIVSLVVWFSVALVLLLWLQRMPKIKRQPA